MEFENYVLQKRKTSVNGNRYKIAFNWRERHTLHHRYSVHITVGCNRVNWMEYAEMGRVEMVFQILNFSLTEIFSEENDEIKVFVNRWKQRNIFMHQHQKLFPFILKENSKTVLIIFNSILTEYWIPNGGIMPQNTLNKNNNIWNELASTILYMIPSAKIVVHKRYIVKCWMLNAIKCVCT